jgi:hypothetical protein
MRLRALNQYVTTGNAKIPKVYNKALQCYQLFALTLFYAKNTPTPTDSGMRKVVYLAVFKLLLLWGKFPPTRKLPA